MFDSTKPRAVRALQTMSATQPVFGVRVTAGLHPSALTLLDSDAFVIVRRVSRAGTLHVKRVTCVMPARGSLLWRLPLQRLRIAPNAPASSSATATPRV